MKIEVCDPELLPNGSGVRLGIFLTVPVNGERGKQMSSDFIKKRVFERYEKTAKENAEKRAHELVRNEKLEAFCAAQLTFIANKAEGAVKYFNQQLGSKDAVYLTQGANSAEGLSDKRQSIIVARNENPKSRLEFWLSASSEKMGYHYTINGRPSQDEVTFRIVPDIPGSFSLENEGNNDHIPTTELPELIETILCEFLYQVLAVIKSRNVTP